MIVDADVRLYSVAQLAELWNCGRTFVYEEIKAGRLKTVDIATQGKPKMRVRSADAVAWVEARALGRPAA